MSSIGVNKTLAGMKSGEVIRPAVDLDSCDSLASKAKGKRKRETEEEDKLNAEIDMPILRSDCDKTEHKGDSQTIQAVTKRVRQDDIDYADQADTSTSVEALEDDERKADQHALNQGLDKTSSQDHSVSSVPDRAMPETLQKGTVDRPPADLHQQNQEVKQPTGQLSTPTQIDALINTALQEARSAMSTPAQPPMMSGLPGFPSSYHGRQGTQRLDYSAMLDLGHASMTPGFSGLSSFMSQLNNDKFLQGIMHGHGVPGASTLTPSAPFDSEDDFLMNLISETGGSAISDMSIPSLISSGTLPYSGLNNDQFPPDRAQDGGQPVASTSATKLPDKPFDIERDLIINPTSEGTSARTAPVPTGNPSTTGERQGEANIPTQRPHQQTRQTGEMTSSAMDELQCALSGGYQGFAFPPRPPLSNMRPEFFGQLHGTGGLPPTSSVSASNLGQDANIDQGNTLHSGIPPDYWGGGAGPSSSGPQMYEAFDKESMIMQQEIERLEAEIARSRSRMADLVRNYPNLPFGTSRSAPAGPTSDIQSSETYVGKGKGRAV